MRTTRLSETEIIHAVKQAEMSITIREIARKYGVCEKTIPPADGTSKGRSPERGCDGMSPQYFLIER